MRIFSYPTALAIAVALMVATPGLAQNWVEWKVEGAVETSNLAGAATGDSFSIQLTLDADAVDPAATATTVSYEMCVVEDGGWAPCIATGATATVTFGDVTWEATQFFRIRIYDDFPAQEQGCTGTTIDMIEVNIYEPDFAKVGTFQLISCGSDFLDSTSLPLEPPPLALADHTNFARTQIKEPVDPISGRGSDTFGQGTVTAFTIGTPGEGDGTLEEVVGPATDYETTGDDVEAVIDYCTNESTEAAGRCISGANGRGNGNHGNHGNR
jgi:hypothetical protein